MLFTSNAFVRNWTSTKDVSFWFGIIHPWKVDKNCRSKNKEGGLGVKDLRKQNTNILCKWWWSWKLKMACVSRSLEPNIFEIKLFTPLKL
jgi:hypothetical protein